MSDQQTVYVDAYYSFDTSEYAKHGTLFFEFGEHIKTAAMRQILEGQLGFMTAPEQARNRYIMPRKRNGRYSDANRASLIVSDDPIEVYAFIAPEAIQRWFKLSEIKTACEGMGFDVGSWPEFFAIPRDAQAKAIATPLMMKCQKERQSEDQVLGYRRLSWDQFSQEFEIVQDEFEQVLLVFPKERVAAYSVHRHNVASRTNAIGSTPQLSLTFDKEEGETQVWACMNNTPVDMFSKLSDSEINRVFPFEQYHKIVGVIAERMAGFEPYIVPKLPEIAMKGAPPVMSGLKYVHYLKEKSQASQFTLDELKQIAREHKVKGFSDKTKAELSIILAEIFAQMGTDKEEPALVFTSFGSGMPADIPVDTNSSWFAEQKNAKPEDHFKFAMRVVSGAAYAPNLPPLPGGRVPTDGNFPSYFGIEPLNIFG